MKTKEAKEILYNTDEAATFKTGLSGWVSGDGRFWGDNEHMARWGGCTHIICECGKPSSKHYTKCEWCRSRIERERYFNLPYKEYDGSPVVLWGSDTYFWDEDQLADYCYENDLKELELLFCEPVKWDEVGVDYWADCFPEDDDGLPDELQTALDNLNEVIKTLPPACYYPGKVRTTYKVKA